MDDEQKQEETTTQTPAETGGSESQDDTLTQDEVNRIVSERVNRAKRSERASLLEELGLDSVDALKETVTAYREKKEAEMSELEKAQAKLDKLKAEKADLEAQMRESRIKRAVEAKAQELNFHNPARAYDLMDRSDVDLIEGDVVGVEESLKALVEAEPYLVKQKKAPDIDAQRKGKKTDTEPDEERKQSIYRRHGVRV
jgi:outer membrane murein-binding lipoprotein Lpp